MLVVTIKNRAFFSNLPADVSTELRRRLTFPNPQWIENEKRGFWNGKTPREIRGYQSEGNGLLFPRGFTRQAIGMLKRGGIDYQINDQRRTLQDVKYSFSGELRDYQQEAVDQILTRDFGTLAAPTGSGKTIVALGVIAARKQPALIVVHTAELLNQWVKRIETYLEIPASEVGIIGGGKKRIGQAITVALVQSLCKCAAEVAPHIGSLIVDECHRAPSRTFTEAVTAFDCKYMLGLSATPWRRDGLSRLIFWYLGDVVHEIERGSLVEAGHVLKAEVIYRQTSFEPAADPSEEYSKMLTELCEAQNRNNLIAADVAAEAKNGRGICLVLSDRKSHCEAICKALERRKIKTTVLTGDLSKRQREQALMTLNNGTKVLIATGQLIGEGFDLPALSTLFLATPIKFNGRVLQYVGRVLRPATGKDKARIYDYVDPVGVLQVAAKARHRIYQGIAGL